MASPNTDPQAARLQAALGPAYAVEGRIGQGGFASVYLVRDLALKRALAVKALSPDLLRSATAMTRFQREAETVAQLSHPHIVPLHFIGHTADVFYLAMAYVEGESLAARLARDGTLDPATTTRILSEVASALDLAHRRGVIHRDIKPHNILLERDSGRALLTDFGIARTAKGVSLTASGEVLGSPTYISPEQLAGEPVDGRADLFALGVVGYEMLAGRLPFAGAIPTELLGERGAEAVEPVEHARPDAPPDLAAAINRCLAREPARRFASADQLVRALGASAAPSARRPAAPSASRARPRRRLAVLSVIALLAAAAAYLGTRSHAAPPAGAGSVPAGMALVPAGTYTIGRDDGPLWSRPAHHVALHAFYLDKTEVTVAEYHRFVAATGARAPWRAPPDSTLPATGVPWAQATAFCAWRHPGTGRLPTEEEWEAAARGAAALRYPWGMAWKPGAANTRGALSGRLAPVGAFSAGSTANGIFDLIGNAWEWTMSRASAYPGGSAPPRSTGMYVIRGGAYNTPDSAADGSRRAWQPPSGASPGELAATGFRCAAAGP
jgi:formylglycine-generating enzyme required for sulfatase activity/tRNA A-37 threonylcarbamoyl transferase component Bud32